MTVNREVALPIKTWYFKCYWFCILYDLVWIPSATRNNVTRGLRSCYSDTSLCHLRSVWIFFRTKVISTWSAWSSLSSGTTTPDLGLAGGQGPADRGRGGGQGATRVRLLPRSGFSSSLPCLLFIREHYFHSKVRNRSKIFQKSTMIINKVSQME